MKKIPNEFKIPTIIFLVLIALSSFIACAYAPKILQTAGLVILGFGCLRGVQILATKEEEVDEKSSNHG